MELQDIEDLAQLLREHPISEISVERQGSRIHLRKGAAAFPVAAPVAVEPVATVSDGESTTDAHATVDKSVLLLSQMVGLFRHANPPLRIGATIQEGQVVGSVESLKLLNDVVADVAGRVVDVFIEEGAPVDYGRQLFRVVPS